MTSSYLLPSPHIHLRMAPLANAHPLFDLQVFYPLQYGVFVSPGGHLPGYLSAGTLMHLTIRTDTLLRSVLKSARNLHRYG